MRRESACRAAAASLLACVTGIAVAQPSPPLPYATATRTGVNFDWSTGFQTGRSGSNPAAYYMLKRTSSGALTLWATTGLSGGTVEVAAPAQAGLVSGLRVPSQGGAYYLAPDAAQARQVFRTQGTPASVQQLTSEAAGITQTRGLLGDAPVFVRTAADGSESAWRVSPTGASPTHVVSLASNSSIEWVMRGDWGIVAWRPRSGATPPGDRVTRFGLDGVSTDLPVPAPTAYWGFPHALGIGTRQACIKASTANGLRLHCTDGTPSGTRRPFAPLIGNDVWLPDFVTFIPLGDRLLFNTHANAGAFRPWSTDGSDDGTLPLVDVGQSYSLCTDGDAGALFYTVESMGTYGLWRTDGTREGTRHLVDVPGACHARGVAKAFDGKAYLTAGTVLYVTDGTAAGTLPVHGAPVMANLQGSSSPQTVASLGRWLVFAAVGDEGQTVLWRLDQYSIFRGGFD